MHIHRQTIKYEGGGEGSRKNTKNQMKNALKILENSLKLELCEQSERCGQNITADLQITTLGAEIGYKGCTRVGDVQSGLKGDERNKPPPSATEIWPPKMRQIAVSCHSCEVP